MRGNTTLRVALACVLSAGAAASGRAAESGDAGRGGSAGSARLARRFVLDRHVRRRQDGGSNLLRLGVRRKFLRSRHRVLGGAQPYAGETWISFDKTSGSIHYDYFNSLGDVLRGAVAPSTDEVAFPAETVTIEGQPAEIRSAWRRKGADAYAAVTERKVGEEWRPLFTIEFVRDATQEWREILDSTSWRESGGATPAPPPPH